MKNYLKFIMLFCVSVAVFSCADAYDIKQDGEFSENATFKTMSDLKLYLSEVYDKANTQSEIGFTSIFTDEVGIGSQNAGQNIDLYNFSIFNNEGNASSIWLNHYTLINYANRFLRGAALVTPSVTEQADYDSMIAEAKVLRAFAHLQLLTYFSTDLKNDNAIGVIRMDRVPLINEKLPRNTNGEVFGLIESDLTYAENNLVDHQVVSGQLAPYKFATKSLISALRARMYAYRGNYVLAEQYADDVINNSGLSLTSAGTTASVTSSSFYTSTTTNPYRQMFADLNQGEVIFALDRSVGKGAIAGTYYFNTTKLSGGPFHDMGRNLFNLMDWTLSKPSNPNAAASGMDGDIRRWAFVDPTSLFQTTAQLADPISNYKAQDVICIDKYPGKTGFDLGNDIKVFRLSEMYFIKAEALVKSGNLNGAAAIIKLIRDKRNYKNIAQPLPVYANDAQAWADILKERRIELCFEGHRYIDLKRLGGLAGVSIDRYFRDCSASATVCTLPVSDYRFTMPISIDEIVGNPQIQQNPGY